MPYTIHIQLILHCISDNVLPQSPELKQAILQSTIKVCQRNKLNNDLSKRQLFFNIIYIINLFSPRKYTGRTQNNQQIYRAHPYYQNTILPGRALSVMVNFRMTRIPYTTPVRQDVHRLLGQCSRVFLRLLPLSATAAAAVIYDEADFTATASYRLNACNMSKSCRCVPEIIRG